MFSPLALLVIPLSYVFLWPLVDRFYGRAPGAWLESLLLAVALSTGALAFSLMAAGLLAAQPVINLPLVVMILAAGLGAGLALNRGWFRLAEAYRQVRGWLRSVACLGVEGWLILSLAAVCAVIVINTAYYPFVGDDTLSRYALQAQMIYRAGLIPPEVRGYPPLAPLMFVMAWLGAGAPHEQLAQLYAFVTAAGTLGAAYLLGRRFFTDHRAGLIAAALCGLTQTLTRNGTLAYTDIPTAFPVALAAHFMLRWWDENRLRDALAAGLLIATALLTKQAALTFLASLAALPVLWLLSGRETKAHFGAALGVLSAVLLPAGLAAAPWYLRNAALDGPDGTLPIAGAYHLLQPDRPLAGLIPPLAAPHDFQVALTPLFAAGWLIGLWLAGRQALALLRPQPQDTPADLIFFVLIFPYWLAWWLYFSFDARFLLLLLPFCAVWAARPALWLLDHVPQVLRLPRAAWGILGPLLLIGLTYLGVRDRLGGVYYAITRPFDSSYERLLRAKGRMFSITAWANTNLDPHEDRLALMDGRMVYFLPDFDTEVMYPLSLSDLEGFDYLVHSSSFYSIYNSELGWDNSEFYRRVWDTSTFEPVYVVDGVHVMRILHPLEGE